MATETDPQQRRRRGHVGQDTLTITDNRTGKTYEVEVTDGTVKAMDLRQIKVSDDDFGLMAYDPAFTNTASCRSAITFIDGEAGHPPAPRLSRSSSSVSTRPTSRSPTCWSSGSCPPRPSSNAGSSTSPTTPSSTRTSSSSCRASATTPIRWACCSRASARSPPSIRRQAHRRPRGALHGGDQDDRQGPDPGRLRLPPQHGAPLRLSRQRPALPRELPLDDVQDDRGQLRARPAAGEGSGHPVHPARRPRAELLNQRGPRRRTPQASIPTRPWRPGWRRCTARCTAGPTRRCCACCAGSRRSRTSPTSSRVSRTARSS